MLLYHSLINYSSYFSIFSQIQWLRISEDSLLLIMDILHRSVLSFDTGLKVKPLQNFIYISLDIFRKLEHNSLTELDAWLYFLSSDNPADILRIVKQYPFFQELYQDIVKFRFQPKELITMYSDALRILDQNTAHYMIEELQAKLSKKDTVISHMGAELSKKDSELSKKDSELSAERAENEELRRKLAQYEKQGKDTLDH